MKIKKYELSVHVQEELARRKIPLPLLQAVLDNPQQVIPEQRGRKAYQSQVDFGDGKLFLLRAIVDESQLPPTVITAYRTSKIKKYWR